MLGMACVKSFSSPPPGGEDGQCSTGKVTFTRVFPQGFFPPPFSAQYKSLRLMSKVLQLFYAERGKRHLRAESDGVYVNTYLYSLAGWMVLLRPGSWPWFCHRFLFKGEFSSVCFSQWLLPRLLSNASCVGLLVGHNCIGGLRVKASLHGGAVELHHIMEVLGGHE